MPTYKKHSAWQSSLTKFYTILDVISPLQLLSQGVALPAFLFVWLMRHLQYPINILNTRLRNNNSYRATKIVANTSLLMAIIPLMVFSLIAAAAVAGFMGSLLPEAVAIFSVPKAIHHIRMYRLLRATPQPEDPAIQIKLAADKKYHIRNIAESLLTLAASAILFIFYAKVSMLTFAASTALTAVAIAKGLPVVAKIGYRIVASIVDPEGSPWKSLHDDETTFVPENTGNYADEGAHSASNSQELNVCVPNCVNKLKERYSAIDTTEKLNQIEAYLTEASQSADIKKKTEAQHALTCFRYITQKNLESSYDFPQVLALIWEAANDRTAIPKEVKLPEDDTEKQKIINDYINNRREALMERLFEAQTAYVHNLSRVISNNTRSCLPGIYNRIVYSQNNAHPDVVIHATPSAIKSFAMENSPAFSIQELLKKPLSEQKAILKSWDEENKTSAAYAAIPDKNSLEPSSALDSDGETSRRLFSEPENTAAYEFRTAIATSYKETLASSYNHVLKQADHEEIVSDFGDMAKPMIHPLIQLENDIQGMILPLPIVTESDKSIQSLKDTAANIYDDERTLDDIYEDLQQRTNPLIEQNRNQLRALTAEINVKFPTIPFPFESTIAENEAPNPRQRMNAVVETLKQKVSDACDSNRLSALSLYKESKASFEALKDIDTAILSTLTDLSQDDQTAIATFMERVLQSPTHASHSLPDKINTLMNAINTFTDDTNDSRQLAIIALKNQTNSIQDNLDISNTQKYLLLLKLRSEFKAFDTLAQECLNAMQKYKGTGTDNPARTQMIETIQTKVSNMYNECSTNLTERKSIKALKETLEKFMNEKKQEVLTDHKLNGKTACLLYRFQPASRLVTEMEKISTINNIIRV